MSLVDNACATCFYFQWNFLVLIRVWIRVGSSGVSNQNCMCCLATFGCGWNSKLGHIKSMWTKKDEKKVPFFEWFDMISFFNHDSIVEIFQLNLEFLVTTAKELDLDMSSNKYLVIGFIFLHMQFFLFLYFFWTRLRGTQHHCTRRPNFW